MTPPEQPGKSSALPIVLSGRHKSAGWRRVRETAIVGSITASAAFSIFITISIVAILFTETVRFFGMPEVSIGEFFFTAEWNPLLGSEKHFGVWPLVTGTLMVAVIAAMVSLPLGLITAVYLSEYAPSKVRATLKPVLEVLAGIPTVVYGFFALTTLTPVLRQVCVWLFDDPIFDYFNSTSAGIAVGVMCLPIVTSMSEDALRAVPRSLREGAFALGSTRFDVSVKVVVPAALSGIIASFLLALARAIGETMIVALAAGGLAQLTLNPAEGAQTITAYMVQIFLGDAPAHSVEYYSSYAVGAVLFVMTLCLTLLGNWVLRRFREEYE